MAAEGPNAADIVRRHLIASREVVAATLADEGVIAAVTAISQCMERTLRAGGKILLAGPFTDGSGSLIVIDAPSRDAVWELLARDPYVTSGVFNRVEVKPFLQVFPHS